MNEFNFETMLNMRKGINNYQLYFQTNFISENTSTLIRC